MIPHTSSTTSKADVVYHREKGRVDLGEPIWRAAPIILLISLAGMMLEVPTNGRGMSLSLFLGS